MPPGRDPRKPAARSPWPAPDAPGTRPSRRGGGPGRRLAAPSTPRGSAPVRCAGPADDRVARLGFVAGIQVVLVALAAPAEEVVAVTNEPVGRLGYVLLGDLLRRAHDDLLGIAQVGEGPVDLALQVAL